MTSCSMRIWTRPSSAISGDFADGDASAQNKALILQVSKGGFRESPFVGVGAATFLLDNGYQLLRREIRRQFELDGMRVRTITVDGDNLKIDANYK